MQLVIGNKNYSSWSMRPWVLLRHFAIPFDEIRIPLFTESFQEELSKYSPTLKVPVLIDAGTTIWDSLAICEYLSEKYLSGRAFPKDLIERARCRSYCSEMHSGFIAIRSQLPMNCRANRRLDLSVDARLECGRIDKLWTDARQHAAGRGEYLFGAFSVADCMYVPVAMRFHSYGVEVSAASQIYIESLLKNPAIKQWRAEAEAETEILADYELGVEISNCKH